MTHEVGYKIVRRLLNDSLVSCIVSWAALQTYIPGEWVSAPGWLYDSGYHLTFFGTEDGVVNYLLSNTSAFEHLAIEVWACKVEGVVQRLPRRLVIDKLEKGYKEPLMREYGFAQREYVQWPSNTAMAERIMLVCNISHMFFGDWRPRKAGNIRNILRPEKVFDLAKGEWGVRNGI